MGSVNCGKGFCKCSECCLCKYIDWPDEDPIPVLDDTIQVINCPKHGPKKQYCRIHHNGFYGECLSCMTKLSYNSLTRLANEMYIARGGTVSSLETDKTI